jgi:methyltransferase (TIGR00027 family)
MKKRRIESESSRTAGFTCMYRAASYRETNSLYKSDDYIAPKLLPHFIKFIVNHRLISFQWSFFPKGIYEYVIARTKYIDRIFKEEIEKGIDQILILGAGFDSRAIRFENMNNTTTFFELDSHHTQEAKIKQFKQRGIPLPGKTVYIPIDFNIDSMSDKILKNGFDPDKKTLFLLEGLLMYLETGAVNELFTLLSKLSSPGSSVIFDYIYASVLRRENIYYGEKSIYNKVNSVKESWQFGIEKGEIGNFVNQFNFNLIENLTPHDLEKLYFTDTNGNCLGRVNGTHCIARIKR